MKHLPFFRFHAAAALVFALAAVFCAAPQTAAATLAASDLFKGKCAETLTALTKDAPGGAKFLLDGSLMAEKHLRAGRADAALLFLTDKEKIAEIRTGDWEARPAAFQAVVIIVNTLNPVESVDLPSLASIYGASQTAVRHWRNDWKLPVSGTLLDMTIYPLSTRHSLGLVTPLFRSRVLRNADFRDSVAFRASDAETMDFVRDTSNAIGLLAVPPPPAALARNASGALKTIAVVSPFNGAAYLPTSENLNNGDYPLAVTLYFVYPKTKAARVAPLLRAVYSDALAAAMPSAGFVPVPADQRKDISRQLAPLPQQPPPAPPAK
ncbi:MAG: substrate-binding domain-containing protein [Puniceicoccales bacterium]|jgi:hypothetical protein|nr:substrate-binding domain-containing protein [Puniceicoccales bacterium]